MTTGVGRLVQKPLDADFAADVVQAEFDQRRPLLAQVPVLGNHVAVTAATNADTDHG